MTFLRYQIYKSSDIEWLGDMPEGWEIKPLRSVFKFSKGLTITKADLQDEGVLCVNYGEIHSKYGFRLNPSIHPLKCVSNEFINSNSHALIYDGDFIFADTSEDIEGSGNFTHLRNDQEIFAGYHTIIARPKKGVNSLFLAFLMDSSVFRSQIQSQVKGVKVFSISQGLLKSVKCWLPTFSEQNAIAEFLDYETSKIDDLISVQRRLISLLKEKRQVVISHAVTKGLNTRVKMKPSGIKWLGDVPEEWEVKRLKQNVQLITEKTWRRVFSVGLENVESWSGRFIQTETTFEGEGLAFDLGDILFGKLRPYLAKVYLAKSPGEAVGEFHVMRPKVGMDARFIQYQILSPEFISIVDGSTFGSKMPRADWEFVGGMYINIPPLSEQIAIADFLDDELAKFDTLVAEIYCAIDLLQQRRTALISDAVTGKIDVRPSRSKD